MDNKETKKNIIIVLLVVFSLFVGCILGKALFKDKSKCVDVILKEDKEKPTKKEGDSVTNCIDDYVEEETDNTSTNYYNYDNTEVMVNTMLGILSGECSNKDNFFITSNTNFNNMSPEIKVEIALYNHSHNYSNKLEDKIKRTFGKNKTINLPKKLNAKSNFVTYELVDGEYKEVADGGGCTGFADYFESAIVDKKIYQNKIVYKVNIGYLVRDNVSEQGEELKEEELHSTIYNNYNKKRIIERNIYYKNEENKFNELLYSDNMDYILFTFIKEDQVFIFDKAELIER